MSPDEPDAPFGLGEMARRAAVRAARSALRSPLVATPALAVARALAKPRASIIMLHRFRDPALGNDGDDPEAIRRTLDLLRAQRVKFLSLRALLRYLDAKEPLPGPSVVFTVDDGYADFATVGAPLFAEFDCPVTVFMSTTVATSRGWFWWDRIEEAFARSPRREIHIEVNGVAERILLGTAAERRRTADDLAERLKWTPNVERLRVAQAIGEWCDVPLTDSAPPERATMTWDECRRQESRGVSFGPHSRTHPIMSQISDDESRSEIIGSWEEIRRECADPVPAFCFPNGTLESFTPREEQVIAGAGLRAALAYAPGQVDPVRLDPADRFHLPRMTLPVDPIVAAFALSGFARR